MNFDPANPTLKSYIETSSSFALDNVMGVNGHRRPLSDEMLEAFNESRRDDLKQYISNVELKHNEVKELLSETSTLDNIQKGWVRRQLGDLAINSDDINLNVKNAISFDLIAKRDGVDLDAGTINTSIIKSDPLLAFSFDLKKSTIDLRIAEIISNELLEIANLGESKERTLRLKNIAVATNEKNFSDVMSKLTLSIEETLIENQDNETIINIRNNLEQAGVVLLPKLDLTNVNAIGLSTVSGKELDESLHGTIKPDQAETNLNFQVNMDFSAMTKKLVESNGIGIHTEHSKAYSPLHLTRFKEEINVSLFDKLKSVFKNTTDPEGTPSVEDRSWENEDYSWDKRSEHFSATQNSKRIKSITFTNKANEEIFKHKPKAGFGGGCILFAKGKVISKDEATLMMVQFLKTSKSETMHIVPPSHLKTPELTKRHIKLLVESALELGVDPDNIAISPNSKITPDDINKIKEDVVNAMTSDMLIANGGVIGESPSNTIAGLTAKENEANAALREMPNLDAVLASIPIDKKVKAQLATLEGIEKLDADEQDEVVKMLIEHGDLSKIKADSKLLKTLTDNPEMAEAIKADDSINDIIQTYKKTESNDCDEKQKNKNSSPSKRSN